MLERIKQLVDNCNKNRRCGYFSACDNCARLRQARFADKAQRLFPNIHGLYLWRLTPDDNTEQGIIRLKAAFKRQLDNGAALWTVEQGQVTNKLHLNVIAAVNPPRTFKAANQFVTGPIKNLREAAAYILKKGQYPHHDSYSGRQHGSFNSLGSILLATKTTPIIQAAALNLTLQKASALPTPYLERQLQIAHDRLTSGDYKAIALQNLPHFRAAIASLKGSIK